MKGDIKTTLLGMGFSEKEAQIYVYLGKRGPQKGGTIAKQLKINKGQVYRTLKTLQANGVVESTLEYPARFTAVPIENVIDSFIKSKREEVDHIEETKKELVNGWNKIRQIEVDSSFEKFSVIEGEKKIFHKISQMIKQTQKEFFIISRPYGLFRADTYDVFLDVSNHPLKNSVKFRFLTQLTKDNTKAIKTILKKIGPEVNIKGRDPRGSSTVFPRMILKDKNEIMLFLSDDQKIDSALLTNSQSIVDSFYGVFQDLWNDSTDIEDVVSEIETGKLPRNKRLINNPFITRNLFVNELNSAKEEILILTSSGGLLGFLEEKPKLLEWTNRGVNIRIMAPIIDSNLKVTKELSNFGEVRHVPRGFLETIIIDGKHLFQLMDSPTENEKSSFITNFEGAYYSNDQDYVEKNANMLENIWMNAFSPSSITLESIARPDTPHSNIESKMTDETKKINGLDFVKEEKLSKKLEEKVLLKKFNNCKKAEVNDLSNDVVITYATAAQAVIHPPDYFNLPHMLFHIMHMNDKSSFGAEDAMIITSRQKTPKGYLYLPASFITDNECAFKFWKKFFEGYPFEQKLVKKEEFHIQVQHNILFAGWTFPITLSPQHDVLPPSCIIVEKYGNVKTTKYTVNNPSGYTGTNQTNYFNAFVTYMHPQSRYSGPGTDGYFYREFYSTNYPPQKQNQ